MRPFPAIVLLLLGCLNADAAVITAASASQADVSSAVSSSSAGDIIRVPAGTAKWTNVIALEGGRTLLGAGATLLWSESSWTSNPSAATIIEDYAPGGGSADTETLVRLGTTATSTQTNRLSGFEFRPGVVRGSALSFGAVRIASGVGRVDHCVFTNIQNRCVRANSDGIGLTDRNLFFRTVSDTSHPTFTRHNTWLGLTIGNGSYNTNVDWTAFGFHFIQSNRFVFSGGSHGAAAHDGWGGSRVYFVDNHLTNAYFEIHGTDSPQERGGRAHAIGRNRFTATSSVSQVMDFRSSCGPVFSNTAIGSFTGTAMRLNAYRLFWSFPPFGPANGTNTWDVNVAGAPFESGTHNGGTSNGTLTDTTKSWTASQWVGYTVRNLTRTTYSFATASTPTTITCFYDNSGGTGLQFQAGDSYAIYKVDIQLDAPGRGYTTNYLTGSSSPTPVGWPGQLAEGCYEWGNTLDGGDIDFGNANYYTIQSGREYFNDTVMPNFTPHTTHPLSVGASISPVLATIQTSQTQDFDGTGIMAMFFQIVTNQSGATINSSTGLYTAGSTPGTDTVRVWDGLGSYADASVSVTSGVPNVPASRPTKLRLAL